MTKIQKQEKIIKIATRNSQKRIESEIVTQAIEKDHEESERGLISAIGEQHMSLHFRQLGGTGLVWSDWFPLSRSLQVNAGEQCAHYS